MLLIVLPRRRKAAISWRTARLGRKAENSGEKTTKTTRNGHVLCVFAEKEEHDIHVWARRMSGVRRTAWRMRDMQGRYPQKDCNVLKTNRRQIEDKSKTNRRQIEDKSKTNRRQMNTENIIKKAGKHKTLNLKHFRQ